MTLMWPWALVGLLAVPALVIAYRRLLTRQQARREVLATQGLVVTPSTSSAREGRWRHVAPVLLIAALTLMILALTRPVASIAEPRREGTVVLAFDVSTSMAATDVAPTRLGAAQAAARAFVDRQPASVRIGVVAFGGTGVVSQRPTTERAAVLAAIARLRPQGETSLGDGILGGLSAIAGRPIRPAVDTETGPADETPIGYYGGTAIVLLTDGENTSGPDPAELAGLASAAGVRIDPVGLGSTAGTVLQIKGFSIATALDETTLKAIAKTTNGTYRSATDAASLAQVYDSVDRMWTTRSVPHEVTSLVAGAGLLLLLAGAALSVLRQGRVI
ncbi:MAG: VWA domain-containing protein [Humibacillus sp.]|nr:VWA domain-containing protein [Humibacillus sp.]MDN5777191.1 VWA domain-containing protein [Humibacillus sp.]